MKQICDNIQFYVTFQGLFDKLLHQLIFKFIVLLFYIYPLSVNIFYDVNLEYFSFPVEPYLTRLGYCLSRLFLFL